MFQNTMRYFFHNELLPNKIEDCFVKVQKYISDLDGIVIYLFHGNVKNFVNQTIKYRGQEFEKVVEEYIVGTKYGKNTSLVGIKGF